MGNLLAATAKNGNQGLFLVIFAIVDSENAANWEWFLRQLSEVVDRDRTLTFVSDRHVAEKKIGLMRKLRECAYAPTVTSFNQKIEALKLYSPTVVGEFLKDLHLGHWDNAYFRDRRYGEICSNAAESFNNWIQEARHLPITQLVDAIRGQIMEQMSKCRVKSSKWAT
ncbi:hypothetical protein ACSBR2_025477 [Camellia fascicularis]